MKAITFASVSIFFAIVSANVNANTPVTDTPVIDTVVDVFVVGEDKIETVMLGENGQPEQGLAMEVLGNWTEGGERVFLVRWENPFLQVLPGSLRLVMFEENGVEWLRLEHRFMGRIQIAGPWRAGDLYLEAPRE